MQFGESLRLCVNGSPEKERCETCPLASDLIKVAVQNREVA